MLAAVLALAVSAQPAPPQPAAEDPGVEVSELIVTARRDAPDPSDVTTECVWRNLPAPEREALDREIGRTAATLRDERPHRPDPSVVTDIGVKAALQACGAPAEAAALPFARTAVRFYALERIATDALAARCFGDANLDVAWSFLPSVARDTLAVLAGRWGQGPVE